MILLYIDILLQCRVTTRGSINREPDNYTNEWNNVLFSLHNMSSDEKKKFFFFLHRVFFFFLRSSFFAKKNLKKKTQMFFNLIASLNMSLNYRGFTEPIRLLQLYQDQLLSVSTGNRLGHHLGISPSASYSSSRLRSDTIRGAITAMELLPLNRMILIASDTGAIRLLS